MIAILGATGYIGRSLAQDIAADRSKTLVLFARNPDALKGDDWPAHVTIEPLSRFSAASFELVINAIGAGDPARVAAMGADIFKITQMWNRRVLDTMGDTTRYVFLSSGAVYGDAFDGAQARRALPMVALEEELSPYAAAKLRAEASHRARSDCAILDLRIFSFADKSISLGGTSFLTDLARAVATGQELVTSHDDMMRDYAGVAELCALIRCWQNAGAPNGPFDLYTRAPVSKLALIQQAATRFSIDVRYSDRVQASPTGPKPVYVSGWHAAKTLGYEPDRDSIQIVMQMLDTLAPRGR